MLPQQQLDHELPPTEQVVPQELPDKLYFRIGEVSKLTGVKPYVLRYWETEFPQLRPRKGGTNQRLYPRKEVELILEIKRLLYDNRYTIEGARKYIEGKGKGAVVAEAASAKAAKKPQVRMQTSLFSLGEEGPSQESWDQVKSELRAIAKMLSRQL